MKTVVWNMNWMRANQNWGDFRSGGKLACNIALLSEASEPPRDLGMQVRGEGKTIGRDDTTHGGKKTRGWSATVLSPHDLSEPEDVWSLPPGKGDRRSPLANSRPGSWTAAVVSVPRLGPVTAISLYGLLDERSDASVHRSLSDLSPLLDDERYNRLLLLGGDLNTLASDPAGSRRLAKDQGVLDRITKGFGLIDLLQEGLRKNDPERGRLKGCTCSLGDDCRHTWTFRSSRGSAIPYQDDYLFASSALAERLIDCIAIPFTDDSPSDHAPIVATFKD